MSFPVSKDQKIQCWAYIVVADYNRFWCYTHFDGGSKLDVVLFARATSDRVVRRHSKQVNEITRCEFSIINIHTLGN